MSTVEEKKANYRLSEREGRVSTLAYNDVKLDDHVAAVEKAWKALALGVLEVKQRIAELDKKEVIDQADVDAVVAQITKLKTILLPGSAHTASSLIVSGAITADKINVGSITGDRVVTAAQVAYPYGRNTTGL